jgi:DNA polymerase-3 subunit delta'
MFEEILGQASAKEYLQNALLESRLPNTLLFTGPDGIGKKKTALLLASILLKTSQVDLHILTPEGKIGAHSIESIREAIDISHSAPFEAPAKVFIIEFAERMQPAAANALLKTLEEPVLDSYWILLTSSPRDILPTILSRCVRVAFHPLTTQQVATILAKLGHPTDLAKLAEGSISKALELQPLSEACKLIAAILTDQPPYPQLFSSFEQIEELLENEDPLIYQTNVSHLFASISKHLCQAQETDLSELEEIRTAFDRNIKLSTCLETFLLKKVYH